MRCNREPTVDMSECRLTGYGRQAHWEYQNPDGSFDSYPAEINAIIEKAFQAKSSSAEWQEEDDEMFIIDFSQNVEIAKTSGQQIPVKRICDGRPTLLLRHY